MAAMGLLGAGRRATARLLRGGLRSIRIRTHPPVADERFCSTAVGAGGAAPWPKELSFSFSGASFDWSIRLRWGRDSRALSDSCFSQFIPSVRTRK